MKKSLILLITLLTLSVFAFSEVKIGVINAQEVIQKTKKGNAIQNKLEGLQKKKQQEIEGLKQSIEKLQKELASPALNQDTREKKTREMEDLRIRFNRVLQDAQKELQQKSQEEMMKLYKEIMPLIRELGKAQGFTLILDWGSAGIAYFDETIDITAEVIKVVDAKFPQ